jgi:hypothetical protein
MKYAYNRSIGGYIVTFPIGPTPKELYRMFFELYDTVFKGHRVFSAGSPHIFGRHCKFHKRLGNKVIYEFIYTKR